MYNYRLKLKLNLLILNLYLYWKNNISIPDEFITTPNAWAYL